MDGSTSLLVKRAKYSIRKDLKLPGLLTVTVTQLYWAPRDPKQAQNVYVDLKVISGTQMLEQRSGLLTLEFRHTAGRVLYKALKG